MKEEAQALTYVVRHISMSDGMRTYYDITKTDFDNFKKLKEFLLFYISVEEEMSLVLDNYQDFELEIARQSLVRITKKKVDHDDSMDNRLSLDRRLINLLSSCNMYLEHVEKVSASLFGRLNLAHINWNARRRVLHKDSLAFRFMYKLRNKSLHRGMPIDSIRFKSSLDGDWNTSDEAKVAGIVFAVIPQIRFKKIEEGFDLNQNDLEELKSNCDGDFLDLRKYVRQFMDVMAQIHVIYREEFSEYMKKHETEYRNLAGVYYGEAGENSAFVSFCIRCGKRGDVTTSDLFMELLKRMELLRERVTFGKFERSFISGSLKLK